MFEFHGWFNIRHQGHNQRWEEGDIDGTEYERQMGLLLEQFEAEFGEHAAHQFHIIRGGNDQRTLHLSGLTNHASSFPLTVIEWLRIHAPYTYGLLYIHNDEDPKNPDGFVVYRLAKNVITKVEDRLLSPVVGTVE